MKNENGVTLVALTIYIIAFAIVIGIISVLTSFFYSNVVNLSDTGENASEFSIFNMYFLEDIKEEGNKVARVDENGKYISFSNGNTYIFQDNHIYKNKVKICDNVTDFKVEKQRDGKETVTVFIKIGDNMEFSKTTQYVMNN